MHCFDKEELNGRLNHRLLLKLWTMNEGQEIEQLSSGFLVEVIRCYRNLCRDFAGFTEQIRCWRNTNKLVEDCPNITSASILAPQQVLDKILGKEYVVQSQAFKHYRDAYIY